MSQYMKLALEQAQTAAGQGEVPIGAIVTHNGGVIASARNRMLELQDISAHAEMLAIRAAAIAIGNERLIDCDLYVTLEPCTMCAAAISFARLRRLYFAVEDIKGGAVENGVRFFASPSCHHVPEIYSGLSETQSRELLQDFFRQRRQRPAIYSS